MNLPTPPNGWELIAPSEAVAGDGVLLPDGSVSVLDERVFDPIPLEIRRKSWAVRRLAAEARPLVSCNEGCGAFEQPRTLDEYRLALDHWKDHESSWGGCSHGR